MIRWITPVLGTGAWNQVTSGEYVKVDVRELVDRGGNTEAATRAKIDAVLAYLQAGTRVVICCDYGMSRSNAIAAGVLALRETVPFTQAVRRVLDVTGERAIQVDVLETVQVAIGQSVRRTTNAGRRRVIVTGASGFLGRGLIPSLASRHDVFTPSREVADLNREAVTLDLLVKEYGADVLLHLANPRVYTSNDGFADSLRMLKGALDVAVANRLHFISISSWEVYSGYRTSRLLADEFTPLYPGGTYGQSKVLAEQLMDQTRPRLAGHTRLRLSPVYGPEGARPRFFWTFLAKAHAGDTIVTHHYKNGAPELDLLHIDDARRAIVSAVELLPAGDFNIGSGCGTSTAWVADEIIRRTASRSTHETLDINGYAANIVMDATSAARRLQWTPQCSISNGLDQMIAAFETSPPPQPVTTAPL